GARIYLDSKLSDEKTPASLQELLPGVYNIRLELDGYYSWVTQANVEPRKVVRLEKIILFPVRPNIKQINQGAIVSFYVDKERSRIYYLNQSENAFFVSDMEGEKFERLSSVPEGFSYPLKELKISPDKEKMVFYNDRQACIAYLNPERSLLYGQASVLLNYPNQRIRYLFWHSDSYHLVMITDQNISIIESSPKINPINLVNLNKMAGGFFYDIDKDMLYFRDFQSGEDGLTYENVYKLEINNKNSVLSSITKPNQNDK
ncbi:MAG: PEGA domain-containing protein, partial [Candidatus Omnitrophota bacterium]